MVNVLIDAVPIRGGVGGGATHLIELLPEFDRQCQDMCFFVLAGPQFASLSGPETWERLSRLPRVRWISCGQAPVRSLLARWRFYRTRMPALLREHRIDVYYAVTGLLPRGVERQAATLCCPRNILPFDHSERDLYPVNSYDFWRLRLLERQYARSLRRSDIVIAVSRYVQSAFARYVPDVADRSRVVYHGVGALFDRSAPAADPGRGEYVLYASRVDPYKHQLELLRAFDALRRDRRFTPRLLLVGENNAQYLRKVQRQIDRLGLRERVDFPGKVRREELVSLYRGARLCVFCSSAECCPNHLLEMMRSGCPMAVSNRGPMPEIAQDGAVYFDPADPDEIAGAVAKLYYDPDEARRLADRAYALSARFTWEATAAGTLQALRDAHDIGRRRLAAGKRNPR